MTHKADLEFDTRKIFTFGIFVAFLYGLSPLLSHLFFYDIPYYKNNFLLYFFICLFLWALIIFPKYRHFSASLEVNEFRLVAVTICAIILFIALQISTYGGFRAAFVASYIERTGTVLEGGLRFVFYPMSSALTVLILILSMYLYIRRDRINLITACTLSTAIIVFAALGSRNLLLWSLSGALGLIISRSSIRSILLSIPFLYFVAVLFAYFRNTGVISLLFGDIDYLATPLTFEYFDPLIHEFGSSFRTFSLMDSGLAKSQMAQAPYGIFLSFVLNQLPSFLKPDDFISFTEYISYILAERGEGLGSSPMTELNFSRGTSLFALATLGALIYWPVFYLRGFAALRLASCSLFVAVSFNVWRIGSAEILKMFISSVIVFLLIKRLAGVRTIFFGRYK